ncbi:Rieske (2Fe-2S) protein [Paracoccus sp. (in: a-proteobacteria)]|uniref:Rieske (2Fe-2S) protein n=1 Tax=Paracoccus sp. TaxID=267 RepID=UPI003A852DC1
MADPTIKLIGPLARLDQIADGHSRGFDPLGEGRDTMFVVRHGDRVHAWRNACPHYDHARMAWKKDQFLNGDRTRIVCGAHGALFEIDSGICVLGPCPGQRLTPVPIALRDGQIFVLGPYAPGLRRNQRQNRKMR